MSKQIKSHDGTSPDPSKGLWTRCDQCGEILYVKHLRENYSVCANCGHHLRTNSSERIASILDEGSWKPIDSTLQPCDPLKFTDYIPYEERAKKAQDSTGLNDAIQTGTGLIEGIPVAFGVIEFAFMGGSMGSVVGEKITRLIEYATRTGLPLILICTSGGARMQEGIFSLMQMAKISAALQIHQDAAKLLYVAVLTSPTTGGVTASFGMLGDIIISEPKALIGFAGRRVIEQTLQEQLPDNFQTAEYLLKHGLLDLVVPRTLLKQALAEILTFYQEAPLRQTGKIPYGVSAPLSKEQIDFLTSNWSKGNLKTGTSLSSVLDFLGINENKEINLENPGTYYADRLFTRLVNGLSNSTLSWWIDNEKNRINITCSEIIT
ncbi:MAG: acetyl-CoA carboxylase carboxyltransferase subunit beta [Bacteroidetes bacterium]|nr:acetyl-CoA carboxylase carboxyltransferase subunit beta [Bacteroidota bacterium]